MHALRAHLFIAALATASPVAAPAQPSPSPRETHHAVWLVYAGDHPLARRVGGVFDTHVRLMQDDPHQRQVLLRPGVSFRLTDRVRLASGYATMITRDESGDPLVPRRPEHRFWVLAQLAHDVGPMSMSHRYRHEHRWLPGVSVNEAGARVGETWVTAQRARYNVRAAVPLRMLAGREVTASLSEEVFASFGGYAGDIAVDQNRAGVALGVRLARTLRVEGGYMLQSSAGDDGRMTERNHVMQIGISSTAAAR